MKTDYHSEQEASAAQSGAKSNGHDQSQEPRAPDWSIIKPDRFARAEMLTARNNQGEVVTIDVFGPVLTHWIRCTAESKSAPSEYVAQSVLAAAAACIGTTRFVRARHGWVEPPILWPANVGDPSTNKSPAADVAAHALAAIERDWTAAHEEAVKTYELKKLQAAIARTAWEERVAEAAKNGKPAPPMSDEARDPEMGQRRRLLIADATTESVASTLAGNPRGLCCFRDELTAFIASFNRYGGDGDRAFYLEAYGA